jgi:predicted SAM-dependent methyltransferase
VCGDIVKSYLNLGCGHRYHPDWINIDTAPQGPGVLKHDFTRGIPLPDGSCDVVYHSAVLEHIRRSDVLPFIRECQRVLKPGGIIRIGVPDLEKLCQLYLQKLGAASEGDRDAAHDYDWIMLEMYDQTVREQSGGAMLEHFRQSPLPNEEFVLARIGEEGREIVNAVRGGDAAEETDQSALFCRVQRVTSLGRHALRRVRERILRILLRGIDTRCIDIGRFRLGGEVHQWMYDRYSVSRLLKRAGFRDPIQQEASSSQIPNWNMFNLDALADGTIVKPDLFFMEATKPAAK